VQRPTADQPYIAGLLDPASNSKVEPNIPAEVRLTRELLLCPTNEPCRQAFSTALRLRRPDGPHLSLCCCICCQVLYDKHDDGLDPANSWAGHHIILNPDFRAQVGG
jgi:hypothetical protein